MDTSTAPTSSSPMEDSLAKWREIHSPSGWTQLIQGQLDPWLEQEIKLYGVLAHAATMAFKFDSSCERCRNHLQVLWKRLHLQHGYEMTQKIDADIDWPSGVGKWFRSWMGKWARKQKRDSNLIGYVAVSNDNRSRQIGRRDIVVAWRGTMKFVEWFRNLQAYQTTIALGKVRVAHGFHSIYKSKSDDSSRYNTPSSASEQVMGEVERLVKLYKKKGEEVSLTITGHSLGGALALLNAYEAASSHNGLPISVITFGAPRVGNIAFRDKLNEMNVKILRVMMKKDMVTMIPGSLIKDILGRKFGKNWIVDEVLNKMVKKLRMESLLYKHVGTELMLDATGKVTPCQAHELRTYLSLLNGYDSSEFKIPCACPEGCCVGE